MLIYGFKNPTLRVPKKIEIPKALNIHLYFYAQLRRSVFKMVGAACELMPKASIQVTKENLDRFKS